ncbi:MAG: DegT/DnrJ/EryC1/StrS family aminotransferase [Candidatus Magnetomorum sp.]|nr:DegT/DnrJ/EryC1/StrS family aminotransferase [Candidatus Magnetomorum sp.]
MIPVNEPSVAAGNEIKYLTECIESGWISSEGPFVKKFECEWAQYVKRKYCIAVSSGTAALEIAVAALGIGKGDEVILPAFTIISCAMAIIRAEATPVLVDSDITTWNMDVNQIEKKITSKTKAIMAVHIYGLPLDMTPIFALAEKYQLFIIEDAAEAIGQSYMSLPCGSMGDISVFSFYSNKVITSGEGGMICTNDASLNTYCRSLRNLCFQDNEKRFIHEHLGWNYRMTNMQAALGLAQFEQIKTHIEKKIHIGQRYNDFFQHLDCFQLPLPYTDYAKNIYWIYGLLLKEHISIDAQQAIKWLCKKGIGVRPFFFPMHWQPVFIKMGLFQNEHYPVSEYLAKRGFYIPGGLNITDEQIEKVAKMIVQFSELTNTMAIDEKSSNSLIPKE